MLWRQNRFLNLFCLFSFVVLQGNKLAFDAKHAEVPVKKRRQGRGDKSGSLMTWWKAQLHRVVADAKRAEAMVRREVGRAIADAKA